ncbi:MAG: OmpA family protein, partial [Rhodobacteraceae bacterium]|nr:OmpA family protein [Paracoccaceae bacterium]
MINRLGGGLLFLVLGIFSVLGTSAAAQAERYVPTIWVDPDGCELW